MAAFPAPSDYRVVDDMILEYFVHRGFTRSFRALATDQQHDRKQVHSSHRAVRSSADGDRGRSVVFVRDATTRVAVSSSAAVATRALSGTRRASRPHRRLLRLRHLPVVPSLSWP